MLYPVMQSHRMAAVSADMQRVHHTDLSTMSLYACVEPNCASLKTAARTQSAPSCT